MVGGGEGVALAPEGARKPVLAEFTNCMPFTIYQSDISMHYSGTAGPRAAMPSEVPPTGGSGAPIGGRRGTRIVDDSEPVRDYPWRGELPTRTARGRADIPHGWTGRVPARPQCGHPRVPEGAPLEARRQYRTQGWRPRLQRRRTRWPSPGTIQPATAATRAIVWLVLSTSLFIVSSTLVALMLNVVQKKFH